MKPLLKWAGGKADLAETIGQRLASSGPLHGKYVEPFLGSGAVFLHLRASGTVTGQATLADQNRHVVNFHRAVRNNPLGLVREIEGLPTEPGWKTQYNEIRARYNQSIREDQYLDHRHAALFLWLNHACYNGLHRENKRGEFNVPVGSYERVSLPTADRIHEVSTLMGQTLILDCDFRVAMDMAQSGDWVYCDPPYVPLSKTASFSAYSSGGFSLEDQRDLAQKARTMAERGTAVVLSNHDVPVVREIYDPSIFVLEGIDVRRSISAKKRGSAPEVLITARGTAS